MFYACTLHLCLLIQFVWSVAYWRLSCVLLVASFWVECLKFAWMLWCVCVHMMFIIRVICSVFTSCCVSSCICIYCVRSSLHNIICFACVRCYVCYVSLSYCVRFHICMYVMSASSSAEHYRPVRWALPSIQTHSSLPLGTHIRSNQIWDLYRFQIWGVHGLEFGEKRE